jgi:CHAT domain-containing protein/tetratricopeptide (TPR) repeat protein
MRACLIALVFSQFAFAYALQMCAQAQGVQHPVEISPKEDVSDIAEQLVAQAQKCFDTLGAQGKVPRVFTGITHDGRQLIIELDSLPFDHVKRRDFLIWLSRTYRLVAYAYATRVMKHASGRDDLVEALDIYASSFAKDVFASLSITRQFDGSIRYVRDVYLSEDAKEQRDQIFLGLHRPSHSASVTNSKEFEDVWATLESKVYWRGVNKQANESSGDEAGALITRALQLYASGNCEAAISLGEQATELLRKQDRETSRDFATALVAQALCHKKLVHVAEAERLYRQAIEIYEKVAGTNSRDLAIALDNLAALYTEHGRLSEAEQLRLRALQIFKATLDPASPHIATALQNLAVLYQYQGRVSDAQEAFLEALTIAEKAYGPDSRQVGVISDNLAGQYRSQREFDKAEPLYLRAISIFRKILGRDHPDSALALQNYAILLSGTGRSEQAEASLKEALGINERLYGANHDTIAAALNTLVLHYIRQQRWSDALDPARRSAAISTQLADRGKVRLPSEGGQTASAFRRLVQVAYGAGASSSELMNEGYVAAQRALDTNAALALSQLAARHATGEGAMAGLLRERQDLLQELEGRDKLLIAAVAKAPDQRDQAGEDRLKSRIEEIGGRIDEIDRSLSKQAPEYAALSKPTPISVADTQALLKPDEALLQFIDLQSVGPVPEAGFAWLITKEGAEWVRLPVGTQGLARAVAALRCGLDAKRWLDSGEILCGELLKLDKSARTWLPFDLNVAFELYQTLIGPFEAKIKGKHLLVVPSGALTGLPLSVLVAEKPVDAVPLTLDGYRNAAWLGQRQPITVLPSVSSLKALRRFAKNSGATKPYLGIGNPLLDGAQDDYQFGTYFKKQAQLARDKQQCPKSVSERIAASAGRSGTGYTKLFRGGNANIEAIRAWSPLPETADELCEVGRRLGVPESEILLGGHATEAALKGLSEQGRLADYGIVHFATHGALTGDVQGSAEPGLILTPPDKDMTDPRALDRDDGFLTASEIATLKLDADWVILSACNTAGGSGETAEALSGMARAFFYAGARALLVSHWEVGSDAAVKLVTRAFAELASTPQIGRSEAFRISMRELVQTGTLAEAHPSQWAPFVVVGEGSARVHLAITQPTQPALTSAKDPPAKSSRTKAPKRATTPDWRTEIWRQ